MKFAKLKKSAAAFALAALVTTTAAPLAVFAAPSPPPLPPGVIPPSVIEGFRAQASGKMNEGQQNSGAQLNQNRQYFINQEIQQRLQREQRQRRNPKVEGAAPPVEEEKVPEVSFKLLKVTFDESKVLTESELKEIANHYLNREVKIADLYALVGEVNALYKKKGYVVCRAFLPQQTIKNGEVHIKIIEGRTGEITVVNNKATTSGYITKRTGLKVGEVSNLDKLNKALLWFNGTNDIQLRIRLQAGKEPGTTDYVITTMEPPKRQFGYAMIDTAGADSTGVWRFGLGYTNTSLFKQRDHLVLGGFTSRGTDSGHFNYDTPITKIGTRLGFAYSANQSKVKRGAMKSMGIENEASYWGFNLTQPLIVTPAFRMTAFLEYNELDTKGDINLPVPGMGRPIRWLDDKIKHTQGGFRFTHYGKQAVLYHEHTFSSGDWDSKYGNGKDYTRYNINLIGQKMLAKNQMLTLRSTMQYANKDYISSADQFYIGGATSVRGYKENVLNGEKGLTLNLEYSLPQSKQGDWIYFMDYGRVSGASAYDDNSLFGYGMGYRHRFSKDLNGTLILGFPTDDKVNGQKQSNVRAHFTLYGQF